ncbi:MAG: hypothetical protein EP330_08130 [Deltaproteobacteria bacterium]|nr:MAG: hypothetical protein EP330_08130 [Deltaproteobacteria bacterium]
MSALHELRLALGGPAAVRRKVVDTVRSLHTMFLDRRERDARYARLQARGLAGERPTDWQMWLAAHHMLHGYILPSNIEFYEAYGRDHWWTQVLRFLDEPSAMIDPIGLGISRDMVISHLVQIVHASAGYDVALLCMFDDGVAELRRQLEQLVAGSHPRQAAIDALIEREDYHQALLDALDRWEADPELHWRVATVPAPEGCEALFDWGIDRFGSPGRLFAYARTLPETPSASLRAWWAGELAVPHPTA